MRESRKGTSVYLSTYVLTGHQSEQLQNLQNEATFLRQVTTRLTIKAWINWNEKVPKYKIHFESENTVHENVVTETNAVY